MSGAGGHAVRTTAPWFHCLTGGSSDERGAVDATPITNNAALADTLVEESTSVRI
jgi:hypothetical protein